MLNFRGYCQYCPKFMVILCDFKYSNGQHFEIFGQLILRQAHSDAWSEANWPAAWCSWIDDTWITIIGSFGELGRTSGWSRWELAGCGSDRSFSECLWDACDRWQVTCLGTADWHLFPETSEAKVNFGHRDRHGQNEKCVALAYDI